MSGTPDRHPGPLQEEEEIQLYEVAGDPASAGRMRYVGGAFRLRDSIGVFDPRTGGASAVFGTQYEQGANLPVFTTSSTSYQQRWRYSTANLPAGTYILFAFAEVGTDATSAGPIVNARIQINDTTTLAQGIVKPGVEGARVPMGGAFHLAGISGVQNIDFDIRKVSGVGSVAMENARVVLWRVS